MKFKNILLYAALLSGMSFSSCTDFLDEDSNPNALSPGIFWKSEGDIMKGLTSVYGALQPNASWAIPFERYIVIDGYRSDEITEGGNLAASKIRNLECPSYEICLIDYGCGKFNRKIHIMEQYP